MRPSHAPTERDVRKFSGLSIAAAKEAATTEPTPGIDMSRRHAALSRTLQGDREQMTELAELWAAKEISSAEWKAAREPIEQRIYNTERQLGQLTGDNALEGLVGNGDGVRASWRSLNLTKQAAIVAAVLDFATILPGTVGRREMDPNRIVPTWSR